MMKLKFTKLLKSYKCYGVLAVCLLWIAACDSNLNGHVASSQTMLNDSAIRFAIAQAPLNLDPRYATDAASERVNRLIYQSLVDFDTASKPVPSLASWHQVSPLAYQLTLRQNRAVFHHQSPVTAQDVKATYDSLAVLKDAPHAAEFKNIQTIEVINDETLLFKLKVADANFPAKLIIGILPATLIQANHDFSHQPIGSGPLKFVQWNSQLTLQRTHDQQIIKLIEVKDPTVRILKLLRGEVDLMQGDLPPELVKHLAHQPDIIVKTSQGVNFSYLGLNMQDADLKKIKVRQAIAYAIDRQEIISKAMVKNTRLAGAILPPEHYAGNKNLVPYTYQPALAKQLLLEAGVKLPLKLVYKTSTDAQRVRLATILQAQMRPAGIELTIRSLDWGTFFEDVKQGQFQLYGLTWVGIKTPEIYTKAFHHLAVPPVGFNRGRFANDALDVLLEKEDWQAATQLIHQQLPYIPLWYEGQFIAANKSLTITPPSADGNWDALIDIKRTTK